MTSVVAQLNGKKITAKMKTSLLDLINAEKITDETPFVVAVNGKHIPRPSLDTTFVNEGDTIEVLTMRQGG